MRVWGTVGYHESGPRISMSIHLEGNRVSHALYHEPSPRICMSIHLAGHLVRHALISVGVLVLPTPQSRVTTLPPFSPSFL